MKRVARTITGLYFDGINFSAYSAADAAEIPPNISEREFQLAWMCPVEIIEVKEVNYGNVPQVLLQSPASLAGV